METPGRTGACGGRAPWCVFLCYCTMPPAVLCLAFDLGISFSRSTLHHVLGLGDLVWAGLVWSGLVWSQRDATKREAVWCDYCSFCDELATVAS